MEYVRWHRWSWRHIPNGTSSSSLERFLLTSNLHLKHPHLTPRKAWEHLFDLPPAENALTTTARSTTHKDPTESHLFTPCSGPSYTEILRLLDLYPPQTITIIALGPLTNLAIAASHSPHTLSRAKEIVIMGGAITKPGNITPLGEFNFYADSLAASRVLALTSPLPGSTMPPIIPSPDTVEAPVKPDLPPYPSARDLGPYRLNIILFPLDLTEGLPILRKTFNRVTDPLRARGSPLAEWSAAFMGSTFRKMESLHVGHEGETTSLVLHDPLCVWWAMNRHKCVISDPSGKEKLDNERGWALSAPMDLRVETTGQWSRGACVVDKRDRKREDESEIEAESLGRRVGDAGAWLSTRRGNRVRVCLKTPGKEIWPEVLLGTIFGHF